MTYAVGFSSMYREDISRRYIGECDLAHMASEPAAALELEHAAGRLFQTGER